MSGEISKTLIVKIRNVHLRITISAENAQSCVKKTGVGSYSGTVRFLKRAPLSEMK